MGAEVPRIMAEAITYADLRFVKAPLKKSLSSRLGQDPEADEDGELTYENVQVPPGPGGPSILAPSGLGNNTGAQTEQPTAAWSSATSPAARRILPRCARYFLLGLLLTCLLLGVAAICLGMRYLQVSRQLQQMSRVLEATNSTLRQQLRLKITQLGQREEDLQGSRKELAQSKETLQMEQKICQTTREELQACQLDRKTTDEALKNKEVQRINLERRLRSMQDTLKPFFTCSSPDTCCPVGWILNERSCFYISVDERSWEESQSHCKSLSSNLAKMTDILYSYGRYFHAYYPGSKALTHRNSLESYWIGLRYQNNFWKWTDGTRYTAFFGRGPGCVKVESKTHHMEKEDCHASLPSLCEMAAFKHPDEDYAGL